MKTKLKHLNRVIVLLMPIYAAFIGNAVANTNTHAATTVDRVKTAVKHELLQEKKKPSTDEAVKAVADIQLAIVALKKQDKDSAKSILQSASDQMSAIITKNPGLTLIPTSVDTEVVDFSGTSKEVSSAIRSIKTDLNAGNLQMARMGLSNLASEVRIETVNIPIGIYPEEIKKTIALIESNKINQAIVDLDQLLSRLVIDVEIIPLPVLRAEALLTEASVLEHTDDLNKEKNRAEIAKFTDAAKEQIKLAELLGYGNNKTFKPLTEDIDAVNKVLFTEKSEAFWQQIKSHLADLKEAITRIGRPAK